MNTEPLTHDQFTKVRVFGNQDTPPACASFKTSASEIPIAAPLLTQRQIRQREAVRQYEARRLVREETHHSFGGKNGLVLNVIGGKFQCCPQVVSAQLRIVIQQFGECPSGAQFAQDQFDRNARPLYAGLAHHDGWIGGDSGL